jgi:hypothetical protein
MNAEQLPLRAAGREQPVGPAAGGGWPPLPVQHQLVRDWCACNLRAPRAACIPPHRKRARGVCDASPRAADRHKPARAAARYHRAGNEIRTPDFTGRALAMERAAARLGKGGVLRYACPANCGDDVVINASFAGSPPLAERVYIDVHDGCAGRFHRRRGPF